MASNSTTWSRCYAVDAIVLRPNVPPVRGTAAIHEFFVGVLDAGLGEVDMEPLRVEIFGRCCL